MATFPSLKPTSRQFVLGTYPIKTYRSLSGALHKRVFGNRPLGHTIDLQFANVDETVVNSVIDHYNGEYGTLNGFKLPTEVFAGLSTSVTNLRFPTGLSWFYAEPPQIESVYRDLSTVTVKLVAEFT